MGKLVDFYKKAESDEKLKADLKAANKRFEGRGDIDRETVIAEVIRIAKDHGYTLAPADFGIGEKLDEKELEAVAGGRISVCVMPGDDPLSHKRNDDPWNNNQPQTYCTAYGSDPHPVFGISIKIN
ncbi:MAG: hypothetical protein LBT16_02135 [Treponema sp.]|jgi:hypothetical protein|nr:hypothetical protein [Treponema sp.]